jgi:hypothetical protein
MIGRLLGLLTGAGGIPEQLRRAYEARLKAKNDSERIAAEIDIARLEARQASHAIGGRWITLVQVAWALPFVAYNAKLIVWDKMLGWGVTDPLSPELYQLQAVIVGFFFVTTTVRAVVRR